jgi:uncharacterized protein YdhG (YjbR/CyaY superfamily)
MDSESTDVDTYLAALPEDKRKALTTVRRVVRETVPEADESIAYGMPSYKYRKKPLAYFAAAKNHCGLYGLPASRFRDELAGLADEKGTIRFSADNPLPEALLRKLLRARIKDIEAGTLMRRAARA